MPEFPYKGMQIECEAIPQKHGAVVRYGFRGRVVFAKGSAYPPPWDFDSLTTESYATPELAELACFERGKEIIDKGGWGKH